jgi:hypothetical protein
VGGLDSAGFIKYTRGRITVLDERPGAAIACPDASGGEEKEVTSSGPPVDADRSR